MATRFTLHLAEADENRARDISQAVFDEIARVEDTFSRFLPGSEISRINREAADGPMVTDPEVFGMLMLAGTLHAQSGGAFDIALGRLSRAWGFAGRNPSVPSAEELENARRCSGWANVRLDVRWRTVEFLREGIELDLGGLAKGYAVDRALDIARATGAVAVMDAGSSSIAATDAEAAAAWTVSIADPSQPGMAVEVLRLDGRALATSGVREQKIEIAGHIQSHLIDPRHDPRQDHAAQGPEVLQVSVLAANATLADGLSTALFLLGPEAGRALLAEHPGAAALWFRRENETVTRHSAGWPADDSLQTSGRHVHGTT